MHQKKLCVLYTWGKTSGPYGKWDAPGKENSPHPSPVQSAYVGFQWARVFGEGVCSSFSESAELDVSIDCSYFLVFLHFVKET